ncbi:hypothetical protein EDB89DRAFT_2079845 [Lactarius sanguifluus]|nr:hypothetical protein EDB89DRAFT_2079845 [Lactarius sanguifluus]
MPPRAPPRRLVAHRPRHGVSNPLCKTPPPPTRRYRLWPRHRGATPSMVCKTSPRQVTRHHAQATWPHDRHLDIATPLHHSVTTPAAHKTHGAHKTPATATVNPLRRHHNTARKPRRDTPTLSPPP